MDSLTSRPDFKSKKSSSRLPPPSLFQGPPSLNASNASLAAGLLPSAHVSTIASPGAVHGSQAPTGAASASATIGAGPGQAKTKRPSVQSSDSAGRLSPFLSRSSQHQGDADGADLLWQEMQNTLAEVELRAAGGEHVFGEEHSKALDDLRTKQLKLAQAWARSEGDETVENKAVDESGPSAATTAAVPAGASSSLKAGGINPFDATTTTDGTATYKALEAETEKDLQQARKRREANDRYFERVNNGVLDVVAKLEEVAEAMRAVERESKDIWSDSAGETLSTTTTSANG